MSFDSFGDFIAMGGHGLYVWLCYGVGLLVLLLNWLGARSARAGMIRQLAQRQRREQALNETNSRSERESQA
ncbi:MAG: heme exporter protein CcmD [Oleiphilaceae bacterium]|nr:heme exporter protein CcmD [Oleiphilaceae bacterium]